MDGVMTKEFVFEEFKKLKTNQQKAKYLRELKETKQKYLKLNLLTKINTILLMQMYSVIL